MYMQSKYHEKGNVNVMTDFLPYSVADPDRVTRFLEPGQNFQI